MLRSLLAKPCFLAFFARPLAPRGQEVVGPQPRYRGHDTRPVRRLPARANVSGAWTFASPNIQGLFRTEENFARMVEQG